MLSKCLKVLYIEMNYLGLLRHFKYFVLFCENDYNYKNQSLEMYIKS